MSPRGRERAQRDHTSNFLESKERLEFTVASKPLPCIFHQKDFMRSGVRWFHGFSEFWYLPADLRCQTSTLCSQESGWWFFFRSQTVWNIRSSSSPLLGFNFTPLTILFVSLLNLVCSFIQPCENVVLCSASLIRGNRNNCTQFSRKLDWLVSKLDRLESSSGITYLYKA